MAELLFLAVAVLVFLVFVLFLKIKKLKGEIEAILFGRRSLSVRYGKMSEQFFPFLKNYPYDPQNFRFLGSPVDGIQFEDDKIVFVEFKAADSQLSEKQKKVKGLVEQKHVEWRDIRIR